MDIAIDSGILRYFQGKGTLTFAKGVKIETLFEFFFLKRGGGRLNCYPITNETGYSLKDEASFSGRTDEGANLAFERAQLYDISHRTKEAKTSIELKFRITSDSIVNYVEFAGQTAVTWGLTNFILRSGCEVSKTEADDDRSVTISRDKFIASLAGQIFTFKKVSDYDDRASALDISKGVDVLVEASCNLESDKFQSADEMLRRASMILSFAVDNWVTPLYVDFFKDGKLVKSVLHTFWKTFPFQGLGTVIDTLPIGRCHLKDFLEIAFPHYDTLDKDVSISLAIEHYVTVMTVPILLDIRFVDAVVVLESLTSRISELAEKYGDTIQNGSVEMQKNRIIEWMKNNQITLKENEVDGLAKMVANHGIGSKDRLRYLFEKFGVIYDQKELRQFGLRGRLAHGGLFKGNPKDLLEDYQRLLNLIDRTILTLFGWDGIYLDKANSYNQTKLQLTKIHGP